MQSTFLGQSSYNEIDKIRRSFIWNGSGDQKKVSLVPWDIVCKEKNEGGLGLRSARLMNKSFFIKLAWGIMSESQSLWSDVIKTKYGVWL